jgi:hypothetical protein
LQILNIVATPGFKKEDLGWRRDGRHRRMAPPP